MEKIEKGSIVGITNSEGIRVVTDDTPYESHGRTYIRVARMVETEIDRGFSIEKDWVLSEGHKDISRLMTPLPGFEKVLANGPDVEPILEKLHSQDIQISSRAVQGGESADQHPPARIFNTTVPGSYEAGLISQNYDLDVYKAHVAEILEAAKAYAGDDPKKMDEFVEAYHRGEMLRPE